MNKEEKERVKELLKYLTFLQRMVETHPTEYSPDELNMLETIKEHIDEIWGNA